MVGPFGGIVGGIEGTPGVSLGGAPRFFGGRIGRGYGGRGFGGGGVYRRGLRETPPVIEETASTPPPCDTSIWDIIQSRDDLKSLRELLANDIPWVAAALDGKTLAEDADPNLIFPTGEPYDANKEGLVPLLNPQSKSFHMDTLFAPNDAAISALRAYLLGEDSVDGTSDSTIPDSTDDDTSDASDESSTSALEMLGAGNATTATAFVAYHITPDVSVTLSSFRDGSLLKTALGGMNRLMVGRNDGAQKEDDDEASDVILLRGAGSQAGVVSKNLDACNGRVFVVDRVLLPVDVDGVTTPEQKAQFEKIEAAVEAEMEALAPATAATDDEE